MHCTKKRDANGIPFFFVQYYVCCIVLNPTFQRIVCANYYFL